MAPLTLHGSIFEPGPGRDPPALNSFLRNPGRANRQPLRDRSVLQPGTIPAVSGTAPPFLTGGGFCRMAAAVQGRKRSSHANPACFFDAANPAAGYDFGEQRANC